METQEAVHLDSAAVEELFKQKDYALPIRWDGKDFYAALYGHLKKYREDVAGRFAGDKKLCSDIRAICQGIYVSVNYSFQGNPRAAYEEISSVMEILDQNRALFDDTLSEHILNLYRVVDVHDTAKHDRKRIFHVPFNMRSKMSTQRYSIPGFPCLYLGSSLRLCCEETGCNPPAETVIAARFELEKDLRYFLDSQPTFDDNKFRIVNLAAKPDEEAAMQAQYLYMYPLIAACSYIRAHKEDPFAPEYIVPQLVTQWVQEHSGDSIVGIRYYSCVSLEASEKEYNYVFPTSGTPHRVRKTVSEYCARLAHRFQLTVPVTIQDYKSIEACEKALDEETDLDYIEKWEKTDEEPAGEYEIPDGELAISPYAFADCEKLTKVVIPDSVTSIGDEAFGGCSNLTGITIPDSVTSIGNYAFAGCSNLTGITIPDSVTSIGEAAFAGCSESLSIDLSPSNQYFIHENGVLYSCDNEGKRKLLWFSSGNKQTSYIIPNTVTSIGMRAFDDCSSLTGITIPDSVTSIGNFAFSGCSNLTSIKIPDSVTSIGYGAFWDCSKLTGITIPDSVASIGDYAFSGCSSLTINCEADSKPEGWNTDWHGNVHADRILWGVKKSKT